MTKFKKDSNGNYVIQGRKYETLTGSRAQVMHGTAYKTSGELTKSDLIMNKNGRIVSKKKHNLAKKEKRLIKHGFGTKKGHFGAVRLSKHKSYFIKKNKSKKMRGGVGNGTSNVVGYNYSGVPSSGFLSGPAQVTNLSNTNTYQ